MMNHDDMMVSEVETWGGSFSGSPFLLLSGRETCQLLGGQRAPESREDSLGLGDLPESLPFASGRPHGTEIPMEKLRKANIQGKRPKDEMVWLVSWLVSWLVGWLVGWFLGWLVGWLGL